MNYINGKNYFGDDYHKYRDEQINASTFWIKTFFPITKKDIKLSQHFLSSKVDKNVKDNEEITKTKIDKSNQLIENY